ncbi:proline racemase family protein [Arthrobacter sp. ISL-72]|nr:proline racemase family protein [Arthrobacter sp. ISL-72]
MDRCPCGTGTCAKMAALHVKGELALNEPFRHGHDGYRLHRRVGRKS